MDNNLIKNVNNRENSNSSEHETLHHVKQCLFRAEELSKSYSEKAVK